MSLSHVLCHAASSYPSICVLCVEKMKTNGFLLLSNLPNIAKQKCLKRRHVITDPLLYKRIVSEVPGHKYYFNFFIIIFFLELFYKALS